MHRDVNIDIVTVQAAADDEHSNPIATFKPDKMAILRADCCIVMGEWIKTKYTDVRLNLDRIFACRCCFHAGKCQPHQTESILAQFMKRQAPNLTTAESIVVGSWVYLTRGGVFQMGTVSRIKNGQVNENQISVQMQDGIVEVGQSWHKCACIIKKARPPVPLHFLDHMIIPIHVGNNQWFPAHLDIKERQMAFLDIRVYTHHQV